jgi:hypothetical protein
MKTQILLVLCTITVMVLASCEKESSGVTGPEIRTPAEIEISAELQDNPSSFENGTLFELCGDCYCNRASNTCVNFQGVIEQQTIENSIELSDGKFELTVHDQNSNLIGEVAESQGYVYDDHFQIFGYIKVTCGTGCLEANGGGMWFLIEGHAEDGDTQISKYTLQMSGDLN